MKKTFKNIFTMAALLMAGAAFTACSSDENAVDQKPADPGKQVYTLTVNASKDSKASTRALDLNDKTLTAKWAEGDVVTVTKEGAPLGTLSVKAGSVSADGKSATFEGALETALAEGDKLTLTYHPINPTKPIEAFQAQDGTLKGTSGAEKFDMATATVTVKSVDGDGNITTDDAEFANKVAMIKLTLTDGTNKLNATSLKVSASLLGGTINVDVLTFNPTAATYQENGDGVLYYALPSAATIAAQLVAKYSAYIKDVPTALGYLENATITFTATVGSDTYTCNKTGYTFAAGSYYAATLTMTKQAAPAADTYKIEFSGMIAGKSQSGTSENGAELPITKTLKGWIGDLSSQVSLSNVAKVSGENITIGSDSGWDTEITISAGGEGKISVHWASVSLPAYNGDTEITFTATKNE